MFGRCFVTALVTAFFPCITFGQIAEIVDSGHTSKKYSVFGPLAASHTCAEVFCFCSFSCIPHMSEYPFLE